MWVKVSVRELQGDEVPEEKELGRGPTDCSPIPQQPTKLGMETPPEPRLETFCPVTPSLTDTVMPRHLDRVLLFTPKKHTIQRSLPAL